MQLRAIDCVAASRVGDECFLTRIVTLCRVLAQRSKFQRLGGLLKAFVRSLSGKFALMRGKVTRRISVTDVSRKKAACV